MIAALAKLHHNVQKARLALTLGHARGAYGTIFSTNCSTDGLSRYNEKLTVDGVNVLLENSLVPFALHCAHLDIHVDLLLGKQRFFDIGLETTQQEGTEHLVQLFNDFLLVTLLVLEPFVKGFRRAKDVREKEIEKSLE